MNDAPLITIIVPVYRVEQYLPQCLDSLLAQTWRNLEILLVDDGSPDRSGEICDGYGRRDPRIRVFHVPHGGVSAVRNFALDRAGGEWIGFVDGDDWVEPEMYEALLRNAAEHGATVSVCGYGVEFPEKTVAVGGSGETLVFSGPRELIEEYYRKRSFSTINCTKLFHRSFFAQGVRFPEGRNYEDSYTLVELCLRANRLVYEGRVLYHYRQRRGSITRDHSLKNEANRWLAWRDRYDRLVPACETCRTDAAKECFDEIYRTWRVLYPAGEEECARCRDEIEDMKRFARENRHLLRKSGALRRVRFAVRMAAHDSAFSRWLVYATYRVFGGAAEAKTARVFE